MQWYHYLAAFGSGLFSLNTLPHFIKGICGDRFPTPFSNPSGKGLSSPLVNLSWSFFNLFLAVLLFRVGRVSAAGSLPVALWFAGLAMLAYFSSWHFSSKMKE